MNFSNVKLTFSREDCNNIFAWMRGYLIGNYADTCSLFLVYFCFMAEMLVNDLPFNLFISVTLKQETSAKQSFGISRFFGKFAKVWNREIIDLVAQAKINSRKNVQFSRKLVFSLKVSIKLVFHPSDPWNDRDRSNICEN